jgi:tRNA (cmo5U34)-methyltransferase
MNMAMGDDEWGTKFDEMARSAILGRDDISQIADACFADLPVDARVLIVGCGTGPELLHLASRHPG